MQYIIVTGSYASGLTFHGPFDSIDDAEDYAAAEAFYAYEVCSLHAPVVARYPNHANSNVITS